MAQTPQEKIDQIKKQFEELNKANEVKMTSSFSPNPAGVTQPLYGQGTIRSMTPAEKRKNRWQHAGDAAKGVLSSIYGAASFIPEVASRIGAAGIDQLAGTNTQDKVDNFFGYVPNKLRDSAGSTYHFDKGQEYTDDALMATALLTAGASGPKAPKAKLQDLGKNPAKYSLEEAYNIVKAAEDAGVDSVKVGKVKLTPNQVYTKYNMNWNADLNQWNIKNFSPYSEYTHIEDVPAYQQKLYSEYNNAANGTNMSTFRDIPDSRFNTYESESTLGRYGYDHPKRLPEPQGHNDLIRPLTEEQMANMRQYLDDYDRVVNGRYISADEAEMLASDQAAFNEIASKAGFKTFDDAMKYFQETGAGKYFNSTEQMIDYMAENNIRPYMSTNPNTSIARAKSLKNRNMSATERARRAAADERARDAAGEQYAALDFDADMARNDVKNMTLDEMYELWKAINAGQ